MLGPAGNAQIAPIAGADEDGGRLRREVVSAALASRLPHELRLSLLGHRLLELGDLVRLEEHGGAAGGPRGGTGGGRGGLGGPGGDVLEEEGVLADGDLV